MKNAKKNEKEEDSKRDVELIPFLDFLIDLSQLLKGQLEERISSTFYKLQLFFSVFFSSRH